MNISFKIKNNIINLVIYDNTHIIKEYRFHKSKTLNRIRYITNPIDEILTNRKELEFLINQNVCIIEKYPTKYHCSTSTIDSDSTACSMTSPVIILELTPTALLQIL